MTVLLMCLSIVTGAAALITTATFADGKTDSPLIVSALITVLFSISITMALAAGTMTEMNCNNARRNQPRGIEMKEAASTAQPAANKAQVKDYYYSAQIARHWNKMNRAYGSEKWMVNKVNGTAYTERVSHGKKPTCKVTDAVLVASGVEGEDLTVEHTNIAW